MAVDRTGASAPTARGAKSRDRLLRAAAAELVERGELQVAAVAQRAQVSVGLPYRYFGNRTGLLIALVDDFYQRLGVAVALRRYPAATWRERERARVGDWVEFLYADPLAPAVLTGQIGEAEVAASNARRLAELIDVAARNITHGQRDGELPADRDPELLAAALLGGVHTATVVALTRDPRPAAATVVEQLWAIVAAAAGLTAAPSRKDRHD